MFSSRLYYYAGRHLYTHPDRLNVRCSTAIKLFERSAQDATDSLTKLRGAAPSIQGARVCSLHAAQKLIMPPLHDRVPSHTHILLQVRSQVTDVSPTLAKSFCKRQPRISRRRKRRDVLPCSLRIHHCQCSLLLQDNINLHFQPSVHKVRCSIASLFQRRHAVHFVAAAAAHVGGARPRAVGP